MNALLLTSGGLFAAKILSAWLSTGNAVASLWIGNRRRALRPDRALGAAAPTWSIASLARRHRIPIRRNPELSSWTGADAEIERLGADILITAATYQIVPENILARFPGRAVNFHPAALPHYRGPHPLIGMILDGTAGRHGGVTLHCLSRGIDKGDIIGFRKLPYDPARGFIHWEVCLARAAAELVRTELQNYLNGTLRASPQPAEAGNYRKLSQDEITLSEEHSASHAKWICDQLGVSGSIRFPSPKGKKYVVSRFLRRVGPSTAKAEQIGKFAIEFDAVDARVRVARWRSWTELLRVVRYWIAILQTSRQRFPASPQAPHDPSRFNPRGEA